MAISIGAVFLLILLKMPSNPRVRDPLSAHTSAESFQGQVQTAGEGSLHSTNLPWSSRCVSPEAKLAEADLPFRDLNASFNASATSNVRVAESGDPFVVEWFGQGETRCRMEGSYRNGRKHGLWRTFNVAGELWQEFFMRDGVLEGCMTTWGPDSDSKAIRNVCYYAQGKLNGTSETWHVSGQKASTQVFLEGKLHGESWAWSSHGHLQSRTHYRRGVLSGECFFYHESGHLDHSRSGVYEAGSRKRDLGF
ncbi:MAG: hypothetical protein HOP15_12370 [Planctomycetes bacterium]|nr:hypothetical protein [Planctomycetota bacterium]